MSELVTGEAVALELRPARLPSRALAVLLDLAVALAVYLVVTIALMVATASLDEAAQVAVSIATFLLVLVGGPIAVETLSHGRSLGKAACGLRVVRDDGGPIRFRHALVRGAIGVVEILLTFGVVACIASLVSARGRRLGDVFAGTLVVRERVPAGHGALLPPPPPWLAGRFSALDLSSVPDGLWLAVRQYLTRMRQLDPQVSWSMAQRLAADVAARTGAPVPGEVPPAMYLAAVLQERQVRETRRMSASGASGGTGPAGAGYPAAGAPGAVLAPATEAASGPSSPVSPNAGVSSVPQEAQVSPVPQDAEASAAPRDAEAGERRSTGFVPPV
ncbi:RDD family protein [Streptomyces tropicalis]|uniref:RDD family protein n=1 Tax=Streptomyces tropicalis TaxID=3034234 RepID=A0ABT6AA66_9ACTN|nr:RDD family protein [Streptomyces tropicalis]MDF3301545.1 RDD family protein [Streptomyces tropicalis]